MSFPWRDDYDGGRFDATVVMSRDLPYSGRGSYAHLAYDAEGKAKRLSGFIEVEFDEEDESVLVHHTYAHHEEHRAVVSGFVWSRRDRL